MFKKITNFTRNSLQTIMLALHSHKLFTAISKQSINPLCADPYTENMTQGQECNVLCKRKKGLFTTAEKGLRLVGKINSDNSSESWESIGAKWKGIVGNEHRYEWWLLRKSCKTHILYVTFMKMVDEHTDMIICLPSALLSFLSLSRPSTCTEAIALKCSGH